MRTSTSSLLLSALSVLSLSSAQIAVSAESVDAKSIIRLPLKRQVIPRQVVSPIDKRDSYNASIYNYEAVIYMVQVDIGTPVQNFTVVVDTGSADLWVPSTACPATDCPYARFNPAESSTYKDLGQSFTIQYAIGSAQGTYATDTVSIGGVSIQNQQLGLTSATSDFFQSSTTSADVNANGILGLGYPSLTVAAGSNKAYNPFMFNLVAQNLISQSIFSIYLNSADATGWSGELILGGIDDSMHSGEIITLPNAPNVFSSGGRKSSVYQHWSLYGQGVGVTNPVSDTTNTNKTFDSTQNFILDTGSSFSYFPSDIAQELVSALVGPDNFQMSAGATVVSCQAATSSKASLQIQVSQSSDVSSNPVIVTIPASSLVVQKAGSTCVYGIAPLTTTSSSNMVFLFGDSILRSIYLVFDINANTIGIAPATNGDATINGVSASISSAVPSVLSSPVLLIFSVLTATLFYFV